MFVMCCFSVLLQRKKILMKRVVLLALVVFFFHSHVVDLLSNLNELFDDFQGQYDTDVIVMVVKEDDKWGNY